MYDSDTFKALSKEEALEKVRALFEEWAASQK
jgi:hypothetical protein